MCPLCTADDLYQLATIDSKTYERCNVCQLTFLSAKHHLPPEAELARYQLHENSPEDRRYRKFLSRLTDHLVPNLSLGAEGLDYGSGPGPTLSVMLEEHGFRMNIYDPYFAPNTDTLEQTYDFITWLGVMTEMLVSDENFAEWWYHREPTHVCFYKQATMAWIATQYDWEVVYPQRNVTLFHKPMQPLV